MYVVDSNCWVVLKEKLYRRYFLTTIFNLNWEKEKSLYTSIQLVYLYIEEKSRVSRGHPVAHIVLPTSAISSQQLFMVYILCSLNRLLCFSGWVSVSGLCHGGGSVHLAGHRVRRTSMALSPETSWHHSIPHSCALLPTRLTP